MNNKKFNYPRIGVGIIIRKANKILLLKRKGSHGEGQWALPGGYVDFGETFRECAVREVKEETELDIKLKDLKFVSLSEQLDYIKSDGKHCITVGFAAEHNGKQKPKICEPDKSTEIDWFDLDDLPESLFTPSRDIIGNFKNKIVFK